MADFLSNLFNKKPKFDRSSSPIRPRSLTARNIFFRQVSEPNPDVKVMGSITVNQNYFKPKTVARANPSLEPHGLMGSFFPENLRTAVPYSVQEWEDILFDDIQASLDKERVYSSLFKGLPKELRWKIWLNLADTKVLRRDYLKEGICYEELKANLLVKEDRITNDIARSFKDHPFYQNNRDEKTTTMHSILRAYANLDPEVGYTQGMNFLVGTLISLFYGEVMSGKPETEEMDQESKDKYEEDLFWLFVYIMQKKNWRLLFTNNTPKLQELMNKLENDVKAKLPELHRIITEASIPGCFSEYYITILLYNCNEEFAKRMLEIFLVAGEDLVSHVMFKVLVFREQEIIRKPDLEATYQYLKNDLLKFDLV